MSAREFRLSIGADILKEMEQNDDLPMPNKRRLARVMMEYFHRGGWKDDLKEIGYTWLPDEDYWMYQLDGVRRYLRQEKQYFEYVRENGTFRGEWKFTSKTDYFNTLRREAVGLGTMGENYNERLEEGRLRWKLDLPAIEEMPALPSPMH